MYKKVIDIESTNNRNKRKNNDVKILNTYL